MNAPYQQVPAFYDAVTTSEIEAENMPDQERLPDTDGDTLPFAQLGGPRFEILAYYLLSGDPLNPQAKVILVKSSGDQGRDLLVFVEGNLQTIVQCKNLSSPVTKPQLLRELVKLALHDIRTPFLPEKSVEYHLWAPGGLSNPAEQLLAQWPEQLLEEDVRAAFEAAQNEYEKLKDFIWDETKERLWTTLRTKIKPWRQLNLDLARQVRNNHDLHLRYFVATSVMSTRDVQAFFQQKEAKDESTRSSMFSLATQASENLSVIQEGLSKLQGHDPASNIDRDIDEARDRIRAGSADEAKTLLKRVQDRYEGQLTPYHRFRIASNLAFVALHESKPQEASQLFLQAAQHEPRNEHALVNQVLAYYLTRATITVDEDSEGEDHEKPALDQFPQTLAPDPSSVVDEDEYRARVRAVVDNEPPLKDLVEAVLDLELYKPEDIADALGTSAADIQNRKKKLRRRLCQSELVHSTEEEGRTL